MVDDIIEKFRSIVISACERYGKEMGVSPADIQIRFALDGAGDLRLTICKSYNVVKDEALSMIMGLTHILGVPTAFGKNLIILRVAPPFIKNSLETLCVEHGIASTRIFVYASLLPGDRLRLVLYNFSDYIKDISLAKLISGESEEEQAA